MTDNNILLQALITSVTETNNNMKELTSNVSELVIADRERVLNDKRQQEINSEIRESIIKSNDELKEKIIATDKKISDTIKENNETWIKSKGIHLWLNKILIALGVFFAIGLVKLLGYDFT